MIRYVSLVVKKTQSKKIHPEKDVDGVYLDHAAAQARVAELNAQRPIDMFGRPGGTEYDVATVAADGELAEILVVNDARKEIKARESRQA